MKEVETVPGRIRKVLRRPTHQVPARISTNSDDPSPSPALEIVLVSSFQRFDFYPPTESIRPTICSNNFRQPLLRGVRESASLPTIAEGFVESLSCEEIALASFRGSDGEWHCGEPQAQVTFVCDERFPTRGQLKENIRTRHNVPWAMVHEEIRKDPKGVKLAEAIPLSP